MGKIEKTLSNSPMMGRIERMVAEMCPEGVAIEPLSNIVISISTGLNPRDNFKLNDDNASYYYVTVKEMAKGVISFTEKTDRITKEAHEIIQKRSKLEINDILFSGIGTIGKVAIVDIPVDNWNCSESVYLIKPNISKINPLYLKHYLGSNSCKSQYESTSVGSTLKGVRKNTLLNLQIPLPPLPIQEAIADILDKFDRLSAELQAELQARKQQYEYYRNQLLTRFAPDQPVTEYSLGEIGPVRMCKRIMKSETNTISGIPFYKIGSFGGVADAYISEELFTEYKEKYSYPKVGDILISAAGTIGKGVIFDGTPSYFQDSNIVWIDNDETKVLNTYLFHLYKIIKWKIDDGGVIKRLYNENLKSAIIRVPPLSEQARIVSILDKFEALVNDLSQGLPAEIAAVKEQYEYYRNKLLTFQTKE